MTNNPDQFKKMLDFFNDSEINFENKFKNKKIIVLPQDSSSYDINSNLIKEEYYHSEFIWGLENNSEVAIYQKDVGFICKRYSLLDIGNFLIQYLDDVTIGLIVNYLYDRFKNIQVKQVKGTFFYKKTKNLLSEKTEIKYENFEGSLEELEKFLKSIK